MGLFLGIFITLFALWILIHLVAFARRAVFSKNSGGKDTDTITRKITLETKYYSRGKEITPDEVRQRAKEADEEIRKADLKDKAIKENLRVKYCKSLDEAGISYSPNITHDKAQFLVEACNYTELVWKDIYGKSSVMPADAKNYITHKIAEDRKLMCRIFEYVDFRRGTTAYKLVRRLINERYKAT